MQLILLVINTYAEALAITEMTAKSAFALWDWIEALVLYLHISETVLRLYGPVERYPAVNPAHRVVYKCK